MGSVEQAFRSIAEFPSDQLGNQAAIAGIGNRQQGAASGGQQLTALVEHVLRGAQMLEDVGADDDVETASLKQCEQVAGV